uniref:Uncharacterized protein n=1 Tax=Oryza meridionalis TaxID=40149 RepID=A0A0E0DHB8_9ORYZ
MGGQKREIQPIESNRSPCSCRGPNKLTRRITSQSSIYSARSCLAPRHGRKQLAYSTVYYTTHAAR